MVAWSLLLLMLLVAATLVPYEFATASSYPYYWFREGVYFVYDVRGDYRFSCTIIDHSTGYWVRFPFDDLKVRWDVLRIEGEWIWVNFSLIAVNAKNLNTSETLDYALSKIFKVNIRTLQAYTRWDVYEEFWAREWPFLLRPEQSLKESLKIFASPIKSGPMFGICSERQWYEERIKPVLEEINRTVIRVTNGSRSLNDYMRMVDYGGRGVCFFINVIPGEQLGFTLNLVALNPPPAGRDYNYSKIVLSGVRLVRGSGIPFNLFFALNSSYRYLEEFKRLYANIGEIAGIYNITTLLRGVQGDLYNHYIVVVDKWGNVYAVLPAEVEELLFDSISGVLVYVKLKGRHVHDIHILRWFDLITGIGVDCPFMGFMDRSAELFLSDTNIDFERPVIGAPTTPTTPPQITEVQTSVGEPRDLGTPAQVTGTPTPRQPAPTPSRLLLALAAVATLFILTVIVVLRYRGR